MSCINYSFYYSAQVVSAYCFSRLANSARGSKVSLHSLGSLWSRKTLCTESVYRAMCSRLMSTHTHTHINCMHVHTYTMQLHCCISALHMVNARVTGRSHSSCVCSQFFQEALSCQDHPPFPSLHQHHLSHFDQVAQTLPGSGKNIRKYYTTRVTDRGLLDVL